MNIIFINFTLTFLEELEINFFITFFEYFQEGEGSFILPAALLCFRLALYAVNISFRISSCGNSNLEGNIYKTDIKYKYLYLLF